MKISELIKELEDTLEKVGDLQVVVQYRDEGGPYYGYDDDCVPIIKNGKIVL